MSTTPFQNIIDLGFIKYSEGIKQQTEYVKEIQNSKRTNTLLFMEHPPTITVGRTSDPGHILNSVRHEPDIEILNTDRGGQITFHGPGQLITYPLINLKEWGGPHKYIRTLETVIMDVLKSIAIDCHTITGLTGVWVNNEKIAAIGVKISKGVAFHGFSFNINTDLSFYKHIIPCGIHDKKVTSLQNILGVTYPIDDIKDRIAKQISNYFTLEKE
tara:strand:- start:374 stop:1018 length:645 start_codon:yes stop_codon:yes gene_type:complete